MTLKRYLLPIAMLALCALFCNTAYSGMENHFDLQLNNQVSIEYLIGIFGALLLILIVGLLITFFVIKKLITYHSLRQVKKIPCDI